MTAAQDETDGCGVVVGQAATHMVVVVYSVAATLRVHLYDLLRLQSYLLMSRFWSDLPVRGVD